MKLSILSLILIGFLSVSCKGQVSKNIETIPATAFAEKIKATPNAQILDVRTPEEFASQHIDNAVNVNWKAENFIENSKKFNKQNPVFVYCLSGGRSKQAANKLSELGFSKIYDLEGGILKWNAAQMNAPSDKIIGICPQEYQDLLKTDKKVLVNFYAEWCAPCKKMTPYILKMQEELKDKIVIIRLDADKNKTIVGSLKLDGLPVVILYEKGKEIWRNIGYISEEDLKTHL
jgi:thioredoxin